MGLELPAFEDLSDDQLEVLTLPLDENHLVTGPPGSGKTVIAIMRAQALKQKYAEDTILLMYGNLLRQYTDAAVRQLDVESVVTTLHKWFPPWYKDVYGHRPPKVSMWVFDWVKILQEMVQQPPPDKLKRHVIVDEGQDMPPEFFTVMRSLSKTLTVFADENQTLGDDNSTICDIAKGIGSSQTWLLRTNYRNTREIAQVAAHFHSGMQTGVAEVPESKRPGPRPVLVSHPTREGWIRYLLNYERANATRSIAVFLPRKSLMRSLFEKLSGETKSDVQIYLSREHRSLDMTRPGIKVISYPSAKGLEFDTVFVPELNKCRYASDSTDYAMFMYVLASRARRELFYSYWGNGTPESVSGLPVDLLDDRR